MRKYQMGTKKFTLKTLFMALSCSDIFPGVGCASPYWR
jgi:hypothetical protein